MAGQGGGRRDTITRAMNVEQIAWEAQNFDYNPQIPLKYWLRSAGTLLKEVGGEFPYNDNPDRNLG